MQQTSSVPPVRSIHLITLYKHDDEPRVINHKYTHKQIHKFEVLERPIDMVDEDNHNNNLDNDNGDYFL